MTTISGLWRASDEATLLPTQVTLGQEAHTLGELTDLCWGLS